MLILTALALAQPERDSTEEALALALERLEQTEQRLALAERRIEELEGVAPEGLVVEAGEVVPEVISFGSPVEVHGRVLGRVVSFGQDVHVHNGAQVMGDAVSFGGRIRVDPGGRVDGDRVVYQGDAVAAVGGLSSGDEGALRGAARRLVALLTFAGLGVLLVGLFPGRVDVVARALADRPVRHTLFGLLWSGLVGVSAAALSLTVVLLPLALALGGLVVLGWLLGFVGLCQAAGDTLPVRNISARRWLAFLVGVLAVAFVSSLPVIGKAALFAVGFTCVGAAFETRLGVRESLV